MNNPATIQCMPSSPITSGTTPDVEALYINVTVKDHTAAVKSKVEKKIEKSSLPPPVKFVMHQTAPRIASDLVTTKQMAGQLSNKLVEKVPRKLAAKGITAAVKPAFSQNNFVVLKLNVLHVDVVRFIHYRDPSSSKSRAAKDSECQAAGALAPVSLPSSLGEATNQLWDALRRQRLCFRTEVLPEFLTVLWLLLAWMMGPSRTNWLETVVLPRALQRKMVPSLQAMLDLNMERKRLVADGVVRTEKDQCRYFYSHLADLKKEIEDNSSTALLPVAVVPPALKQASKSVRPAALVGKPLALLRNLP